MTDRVPAPGEPMALLGGTFDPVHYGHLRCADEARRKLMLDNLYLLPSGTPPHRGTPQASKSQRLDMLRLACQEFPNLLIDERETRRDGPSYMVETLQELRGLDAQRPLILLIGQDAANLLHTWFEWKRLFELTHLVILTRPGELAQYPPELNNQIKPRLVDDAQSLLESDAGLVVHLQVESIDISASEIKRIIRSGRSPGSMLPAKVLEYVNANGIYLTG